VNDINSYPDNFDTSYSKFNSVMGFIHCPWSKTCEPSGTAPHTYTYTNVRRPPEGYRILDLLDEIFEWKKNYWNYVSIIIIMHLTKLAYF